MELRGEEGSYDERDMIIKMRDRDRESGGFVFDCRSLANPGRYVEYKKSTGMDQDVIDFFADKTDMANFLNHVYSIIDNAVETYSGRGFTNLMVNFGCTGGQHRSVFSAENLTRHLLEKFDVSINVNHQEQNVSKSF